MYNIMQNFINNNRSRQQFKPQGIGIHETATPGATAQNERDYFNRAYRGASAHFFVDNTVIMQTIPVNEKAWHAMEPANSLFIGVECCNFNDSARFIETYNRAIWLCAKLLLDMGIRTVTKDNLMSHAEISKKWGKTNHTDPVAYFNKFSKTVDKFRNDVQWELNQMIQPVPQPQAIYKTVNASALNIRTGAGTQFAVLGTYKRNEKVRVYECANGFYKTDRGWCSAQYLV